MIRANFKQKQASNFIFVDGFDEGTLSYALYVILGYCHQAEISRICFYKTDLDFIKKIQVKASQATVGPCAKIQIVNYKYRNSTLFFLSSPYHFVKFLFDVFNLVVWVKSAEASDLLKYPRTDYQRYITGLRHSYWDSLTKKYAETDRMSDLTSKLSVINRIVRSMWISAYVGHRDCKAVWVGHNVYHTRVVRERAIFEHKEVFGHAYFTFNRMSQWDSIPAPILTKASNDLLRERVSDKLINMHMERRYSLRSGNPDIARAREYLDLSCDKRYSNVPPDSVVLFLPVLRDSPFNWLDMNRPFGDYFEWLKVLIPLLINQDSPVIIRYHPSSNLWGENSRSVIEKKGLLPKHHGFLFCDGSNYDHSALLKEARQILTFRGTAHFERACFGFKPIIFSKTMLSEFLPNAVLFPKNISCLQKFLKLPPQPLNMHEREFAKTLLVFKENYVGFRRLIGGEVLLKNERSEKRKEYRKRLELLSHKYGKLLFDQGRRFESDPDFDQTIYIGDEEANEIS